MTDKRQHEVTIWYVDESTYQATITVEADDEKDAAAQALRLSEAGQLDFHHCGGTQGGYGFEVKKPDGKVATWAEDEQPLQPETQP